jgi:NAD(P)-dependent dehydrogenase (short-subunit alcohol dehydrogenase family)
VAELGTIPSPATEDSQAIAPGPTLTGLTRVNYADPERRRATIAQILLGRMGQPENIVGAIPFFSPPTSPAG